MLMPKREKYRRPHSMFPRGMAQRGAEISFGEYGLKALAAGRVTAQQIEASRIAISRATKRLGKVWIRVFPHWSVTKKPAETRMGTGKGAPEFHAALVKAGTVLFEIGGVSREMAEEALRLASHKLPMKTRFISRTGQ